jgi:hypothetical protein
MMSDYALGADLICASFLTGLIWFVQVVHYPLFAAVGPDAFAAYHRAHTRRTTLVVAAPMLIEMATSLTLVVRPPMGVDRTLPWVGLTLVVAIWLITALVQVPLHGRLAREGRDLGVIQGLVRSNRVRVLLWTLHAATLAQMLRQRGA